MGGKVKRGTRQSRDAERWNDDREPLFFVDVVVVGLFRNRFKGEIVGVVHPTGTGHFYAKPQCFPIVFVGSNTEHGGAGGVAHDQDFALVGLSDSKFRVRHNAHATGLLGTSALFQFIAQPQPKIFGQRVLLRAIG